MKQCLLPPPPGYDHGAVATAALVSQLDPLLDLLVKRVKDATVDELEWQLRPGVNTIGMLLAHMAISETAWIQAVSRGIDSREEESRIVHAVIGIRMEDDGMPLPPHGTHPETLAGTSAGDYLAMLRRARDATHATVRGWDDRAIEQLLPVDGTEVSRAWMLFHVVEHFAQHLGQIALLRSIRRTLRAG
jgi:uncharacterized damage-inducible protein DinB